MTIRIGRGSASAVMSGDLERMVERVLRQAAPTAVPIMEKAAAELRAGAEARWPVGRERHRPHSRDLFEHGLRIPDHFTIQAYVLNKADYAFYIKSTRQGLGGKSASVELLRKPLKAIAPRVAKDIAEAVGGLIGGKP